jgi:hypothetical protein
MFDKLVEQKIREAMEAGEFDRLEGSGRPVDLETYFSTPEELRVGLAMLRNAGVLPEEAVLLKELNELAARLEGSGDEAERQRLRRAAADLRLKYDLLVAERRRARR